MRKEEFDNFIESISIIANIYGLFLYSDLPELIVMVSTLPKTNNTVEKYLQKLSCKIADIEKCCSQQEFSDEFKTTDECTDYDRNYYFKYAQFMYYSITNSVERVLFKKQTQELIHEWKIVEDRKC